MTFFESLFLGIVQGITEFFPISSSAHLKLFKTFFNSEISADFYLFDLICHLGTILASIIFLRKEIIKIFKSKNSLSLIFLAILPLFPFYFLLKKPFIEFLSDSHFLPYFLLFTAIFLYIFSNLKIKEKENISYRRKITDVLLIGIMQALALIPGLSRSASTISSAYFRGWRVEEAIRFSFLLSIPTILGGSFLEGFKHIMKKDITYNLPISSYLAGFLAAFIVGFFAIRYIFSIRDAKKLKPFAWYMLIFAIFSFVCLNM